MLDFLKHKPPFTQLVILLCVVLVSMFVVGMFGMLAVSAITGVSIQGSDQLAKLDLSRPDALAFLRGMQLVQFFSMMVVPVWFCARIFSDQTREYLWLHRPSRMGYFLVGAVLLIAAIPLTNLLGEINRGIEFPKAMAEWMRAKEADAERTVRALLSQRGAGALLLNLLFIAVLAAVGEELLFRGMVQRLLIRWSRRIWVGIVVTAIIFSAMHLQFYGFLPRFVLGILLGVIYWYSGSLWVAILAHFVYDAVLIVAASFRPELLDQDSAGTVTELLPAGLLSLAVIAGLWYWMRRRSNSDYSSAYGDEDAAVNKFPF
jgi:membrane protease YdiL (CAAX protease family)